MQPTRKHPQIEKFLEKAFGRTKAITGNTCAACHATVDPNAFQDAKSRTEYRISGLCQTCQDAVFGTDEED